MQPKPNRNLSVLAIASFLRGAHNSVYSVIWQPFVLSLGASMSTLGLLNSIGGMGGIVTTLVQPLGGWYADRVGRKPFLIIAGFANIGAYALFAMAGALSMWTLLMLGVILLGASALSRPAITSLTAESAQTEQQGSAFSLTMVTFMVPGIVAPAVGGWLADRIGHTSLFPIALAIEAVAVLLIWRYLRETSARSTEPIRWREAVRALIRALVPPRGMTGFFFALALDSFSWGMGWGILYGMATETFGFSGEQLGIMSSIMSLTWAVTQMPIGRYIDRRGAKTMMLFSEWIGVPLMLVWMTQTRFEIYAASMALFALTAATWVPAVNTYLSRRVDQAQRAEAFGRLSAFRCVLSFPAPAIGSLLYERGGMRAPLVANLVGIFLAIAVILLFVHEPKSD